MRARLRNTELILSGLTVIFCRPPPIFSPRFERGEEGTIFCQIFRGGPDFFAPLPTGSYSRTLGLVFPLPSVSSPLTLGFHSLYPRPRLPLTLGLVSPLPSGSTPRNSASSSRYPRGSGSSPHYPWVHLRLHSGSSVPVPSSSSST